MYSSALPHASGAVALAGAERALLEARRLEPDNPAIAANLGILQAAKGDLPAAVRALEAALVADPNLHEARFNLAAAYAQVGRRADAAAAARELLARLPPTRLNAQNRTAVARRPIVVVYFYPIVWIARRSALPTFAHGAHFVISWQIARNKRFLIRQKQ